MFFQKEKDAIEHIPDNPKDKLHWDALLRGQVLTATTAKLVNYIALADQKAQAMIIINSILIPVILP